ncbi:MAG: GTPase Era [Lachnospiraceae bacterium]|nr:GTPase Era [Lachnospiraceae bacterium]MBQ1515087.1 GTPase Era [Lachnospiraceae bacterium]MBQ4308728.1 GTPase Era [Lachnospiraceae bacterium]MBQ9464784.1 GTPase Era [Lachnospiraceae bacterium]MBR2738570.1 GTPase Era [Lachnospiraceae bacterium]
MRKHMSETKQPFRSGFAAMIGRTNVGKSTFLNTVLGQKIAITSNKPQTTRSRQHAVYTDERGQIVFLDTPGIHKAKTKLGEYMITVADRALRDVDVIVWMVEPKGPIGEGERHILKQLETIDVPVILLINKIDTVPKEDLLARIAMYAKEYEFAEIVPVSALKGEGTDEVVSLIFDRLPEGPMYYDEDTVTDTKMRDLAAEFIREKALKCLKDEVPHGIAVAIEQMTWNEEGNRYDIDAAIICERDSHKRIIIGKGGEMIKKIGSAARFEIERMAGEHVNLKLWVKVRKGWRDNDTWLRDFGYDRKNL